MKRRKGSIAVAEPSTNVRVVEPLRIYLHRGVFNREVRGTLGGHLLGPAAPLDVVIDGNDGVQQVSAVYRRTNYLRTVLHDGRALSCRVFMPSALVTPEGNLL